MQVHTDRQRARTHLTLVASSSHHAPGEVIGDYARHCLRYIDCAPEGATFLIAPLQGWDGTPFTPRDPQGPASAPCKRLRDAIERRTGKHWLTVKQEQHDFDDRGW